MYEILTNPEEIADAQRRFQKQVGSVSRQAGDTALGFRGGSVSCHASWLPEHGMWHGHRELERRHWNAFGFGNPFDRTPSIVVEICPPLKGIDRRTSGVFVRCRDDHGRVWLALTAPT